VQELLQKLFDKGEIERRTYEGWYCTPDERFWTEKEISEGKCPDCGRPVERILEDNYFFLMSRYQARLIAHIEQNQNYIRPESRRNEVLGFLRSQTLGDLCISRPKARLSWGIELPFDRAFVTYVWFDALVNYFSATRYLSPSADGSSDPAVREKFWWPADHHLVGKDILTTHSVYWSTMLMALGLPLRATYSRTGGGPRTAKMSKSIGGVIDPRDRTPTAPTHSVTLCCARVPSGWTAISRPIPLSRALTPSLLMTWGTCCRACSRWSGNILRERSRRQPEQPLDQIQKSPPEFRRRLMRLAALAFTDICRAWSWLPREPVCRGERASPFRK
jgi:hypothetical protein